MRVRSRRYHVVINNFTYEEEQRIQQVPYDPKVCFCYASEEHLDEETETPHIHCYIEFNNQVSPRTVKDLTSQRAHVEIAKGTRKQNVEYVSKEGNILVNYDPNEFLVNKADKKARAIIEDIANLTEDEFIKKHPAYWLKNFKNVDELRARFIMDKLEDFDGDLQKKNFWIWGPTGVGKSTLARKGCPSNQICCKDNNRWFFAYNIAKHRRIVFDDFPRYDNCPGAYGFMCKFKRWSDRYKCPVECKGGYTVLDPKCQIVITSNFCIDDCIPPDEDHEAVKRRFCIIHLTSKSDIINYLELLKVE